MTNFRCWFAAALLLAVLPIAVKAQTMTWAWAGGNSGNNIVATGNATTPANWTAIGATTGNVDLNNTATTLIFGTGNYTPTPYLENDTAIQIGTLTINTTGSIWAGHGNGIISGPTINGVNVATALNYSPSGTGSSASLSGPIMFGSGFTIGGTADSTSTLTIGVQVGDYNTGGHPVPDGVGKIASVGSLTKNNAFQLQLGGDASSLGPITINGGSVFLNPQGSGFESNVTANSNTTFGLHPANNATYTYSGVIDDW